MTIASDKTVLYVYWMNELTMVPEIFFLNSLMKRCTVIPLNLARGYYMIDLLKKPSLIRKAIARRFDRRIKLGASVEPDLIFVSEAVGYPRLSFDYACPKAIFLADSIFQHDSQHWDASDVAETFDYVFSASKTGVDLYKEAGGKNVEFLPFACDPTIHKHHSVGVDFDICFVGSLWGDRGEITEQLGKQFKTFVGKGLFQHKYAETYSRAKIVFNSHSKKFFDGPGTRVFEAMGCGTLLLTDPFPGWREMFEDGKHLAIYHDRKELFEKAAYYLKADDERKRIAQEGQREVYLHHTYDARIEKLLKTTGIL